MSVRRFVSGLLVISAFFALVVVGESGLSVAADETVEQAFGQLDVNEDGFLTGTEATKVLAYDGDGDGEISFDEYTTGLQAEKRKSRPTVNRLDRAAAEEKFRALDGNNDGRLSGTEMRGQEQLDRNEDQRITLEEFLAAMATEENEAESDVERVVVVPVDEEPFTVGTDEVVRLSGQGITGSTITAQVTGPAKVTRASYVRNVSEGHPLIGGEVREFELRPTGRGQVTVLITVEYPTGGEPNRTRYRFSVESPNNP